MGDFKRRCLLYKMYTKHCPINPFMTSYPTYSFNMNDKAKFELDYANLPTESANDFITSEIISNLLHLGAMLKCNNYFVMRMNNDIICTTFHASAIHASQRYHGYWCGVTDASMTDASAGYDVGAFWRRRHSCIFVCPSTTWMNTVSLRWKSAYIIHIAMSYKTFTKNTPPLKKLPYY
jgi:hypothetical protein